MRTLRSRNVGCDSSELDVEMEVEESHKRSSRKYHKSRKSRKQQKLQTDETAESTDNIIGTSVEMNDLTETSYSSKKQTSKTSVSISNSSTSSGKMQPVSRKQKKSKKRSKKSKAITVSSSEDDILKSNEHHSASSKDKENYFCTPSKETYGRRKKKFFLEEPVSAEENVPKKKKKPKTLMEINNSASELTGIQCSEEEELREKENKLHYIKSFTDKGSSAKSKKCLISNDDRPSFMSLVTSTNKKQLPNQNVSEHVEEENNSKKYKKTPNKDNSSSFINPEDINKSDCLKNTSTPKEGNGTYDLVNSQLSNGKRNKSSNLSTGSEKQHGGGILYLDDISAINMDEIIDISDETLNSKRGTFDISNKINSPLPVHNEADKSGDSIKTQSGEWKVHDSGNVNNFTDENVKQLSTSKQPAKTILKDENLATPDSKKRKKWIKFAIDSEEAKSLLNDIGTPEQKRTLPKTPKRSFVIEKTPKPKHHLESKSDEVLTYSSKENRTKSSIKRTTLPNFAKIHQRAFEKMESVKDYSERKRDRAKFLLSSSSIKSPNQTNMNYNRVDEKEVKTSRNLFKVVTPKELPHKSTLLLRNSATKKSIDSSAKKLSRNLLQINTPKENLNKPRLSFKNSIPKKAIDNPEKKKKLQTSKLPVRIEVSKKAFVFSKVPEKVQKQPVFDRSAAIAAANKMKTRDVTKMRDTNRTVLKGVRTNRRFDLLMQMRNK